MKVLTARYGNVEIIRTLNDPQADVQKEQADLNRRAEQLNVLSWAEMYEEKFPNGTIWANRL